MQQRDPIGISGIGPSDEYDSYIGTIVFMLLDERTNYQHITNQLPGLATTEMGLSDGPN